MGRTSSSAEGPERAAGEAGFTIVEMMVALSLLAVAMVAISGVFFTGLKAASATATRTSAVALATKETEAIRAVPYDDIGFYADQAGFVATFEGDNTVTLGAATPAAVAPRLAPTGSETVGPVTYDITRHLTLVDAEAPSQTYNDAYKKSVVVVTWTDGSGPHRVRQDSIVYPGGLGAYGATSGTVPPGTVAPTAPTLTSVSPPTDPPGVGETRLDVAWTPPAAGGAPTHYIVQWATNSAFSAGVASSPEQPDTATSYQATGLSPSTNYFFRVIAYAGSALPSPPSNVVSGTTLAPTTPPPCTVGGLTLTGTGNGANQGLSTKTYLQNGSNRLLESLNLVVSYSGSCTGTFSVRGQAPNASNDPGSPYSVSGGGTGTDSGVIPATTTSWANGVHTFTVLQGGVAVSPPVTKTFLFCAATNNKSSNPNQC